MGDVRVRLRRYKRGTSRIAGHNTSFVGYRVECSCGFGQRYNHPKRETIRQVVRPHLREAHGLRGAAADEVIHA